MTPEEKRKKLAALLKGKGVVVLPGAYNAICAKLIEKIGFNAVYISGAGIVNSLGYPDTGIVPRGEFIRYASYIANATALPTISDADTGFDDIAETVHEFEKAGISGIHIEDQQLPKRCGHLRGKEVVPPEEMAGKIREAVRARGDKNFLIIARTDAKAVEGYEAAVKRAKIYLTAGADAIFPEALEERDEFKKFHKDVGGVLLANMTEFGKTPYISAGEFYEMGYKMVIFPLTAFRAASKAAEEVLKELKRSGTQKGLLDRMQTREELYDLLNYTPKKTKKQDEKNKKNKTESILKSRNHS